MFLIGIHQYAATIAPAGSLSAGVPMGVDTLVGISMPAVWAAAVLSFQVSPDGGTTWQELFDDTGAEMSIIAAAGQFIRLTSYLWRGMNILKVRSGTAASPVVQTPGAVVTLIGRPEIA